MKKLIALILSLILVLSICSVSAFAEETTNSTSGETKYKDDEISTTIVCLYACKEDGIITEEQYNTAVNFFDLDKLKETGVISDQGWANITFVIFSTTKDNEQALPNEYSFGQGTFIVGQDLKAGTYDITCESSSGSDMDSSMAGLSDFYNSQGMSDYANMIDSMSGMYGSIGGMTIKTYKAGVSYSDQYLTLKAGETARIILEDGGKIEISDGTAKLVWIR